MTDRRTVDDEHDEEHAGAEAARRVLSSIGSVANDVGVAECRDEHRHQRYDEDANNPLSICADPIQLQPQHSKKTGRSIPRYVFADAQNDRSLRQSICRIDLRLMARSDSTSNMDRIIGPNSMLSTTCRCGCQ